MNNEKKLKYEYKFNEFIVNVPSNKSIYYTYYLKKGNSNKKTGTYMLNPKIPYTVFNNLSKNMTIILVAHRLNTVQNCDIIFNFKNGKLMSQGTFKELFGNNKD